MVRRRSYKQVAWLDPRGGPQQETMAAWQQLGRQHAALRQLVRSPVLAA